MVFWSDVTNWHIVHGQEVPLILQNATGTGDKCQFTWASMTFKGYLLLTHFYKGDIEKIRENENEEGHESVLYFR